MVRHVWPIFVLFCACGGSTRGAEPPAPPLPPEDEPIAKASAPYPQPAASTDSPPAVAKPSPMQFLVNELGKAGFDCAALGVETPTLQCADANHRGSFVVTYSDLDTGCTNDDPCFVRLISHGAPRAFGTPCEKFADAMSDLTNVAHHFAVSCNDTTSDPATSQQFGFTTTITVTDPTAPGVVAALPVHQADRLAAIKKLASIKAIEGSKKAGPREKHDVVH